MSFFVKFNRNFFLVAVCILVSMISIPVYAAEISESGFTVKYPDGMEKQAKSVLEKAKKSITPYLDVHLQILNDMKETNVLADDIAFLLSINDDKNKVESIKKILDNYRASSAGLVECFRNIELIKKEDIVSKKEIDAGILVLKYDEKKDEFLLIPKSLESGELPIANSFLPLVINPDGTIRGDNKLEEMAMDFLGTSKLLPLINIHQTVSFIISDELGLYYPFSRWFTEGVSGYVSKEVVKRYPQIYKLAEILFVPNEETKKLREKVNLIAWPQSAFQNKKKLDPIQETANMQYSVELMSAILSNNGKVVLPKIMSGLKYNSDADTETILAKIKEVTGTDYRNELLKYTPADVREGILAKRHIALIESAEKFTEEKKYAESRDALIKVLEMTPEDINSRLNLAWMQRENEDYLDSEFNVFISARLMKNESYSFKLFGGGGIEGNYVLGRLAILLGNLEYAKKFIEPVLEAKPDHKDAKRAMDEINKITEAVKNQSESSK
ncbi:MAG: hypothetical protein SNJ70_00415 [Armatimonadota bacterium]